MTKAKSAGSFLLELLKIILISLAIIVPVRYYLIQPFIVRGSSMEHSFYDGEYLIVDEISYRFEQPERGDVIVFKYPKDITQYYIKRIIGLPQETVEVTDGEVIIYNNKYPEGEKLEEKYLDGVETPGNLKVSVPANNYFVLGDNRRASSDSRVWGFLPKDDIIGRVWVRGLPPSRIGAIKTPEYEFN